MIIEKTGNKVYMEVTVADALDLIKQLAQAVADQQEMSSDLAAFDFTVAATVGVEKGVRADGALTMVVTK